MAFNVKHGFLIIKQCFQGYSLQKEEDACCGRCVPTACFIKKPDGNQISIQASTAQKNIN